MASLRLWRHEVKGPLLVRKRDHPGDYLNIHHFITRTRTSLHHVAVSTSDELTNLFLLLEKRPKGLWAREGELLNGCWAEEGGRLTPALQLDHRSHRCRCWSRRVFIKRGRSWTYTRLHARPLWRGVVSKWHEVGQIYPACPLCLMIWFFKSKSRWGVEGVVSLEKAFKTSIGLVYFGSYTHPQKSVSNIRMEPLGYKCECDLQNVQVCLFICIYIDVI